MGFKIKQFLLNSKFNAKLWGVSPETIDTEIQTFRNKPYVINSVLGHPKITSDTKKWVKYLVDNKILDPHTNEFIRKLEPMDLVNAEKDYQKNFQVGIIEDIQKEASGNYWAIIDITDPQVEQMYKEKQIPPFSSPYIIGLNPKSSKFEPTRHWHGIHLAAVADPAFGMNTAYMKAMCEGDGNECSMKLLTASVNDVELVIIDDEDNSSNFSDNLIKNVIMSKNKKNQQLGQIFKSKDKDKDNDISKLQKTAQVDENPNGNPNPQENNGNNTQLNEVINACVSYMTQNGNMPPDAATQYCSAVTEIIVRELNGKAGNQPPPNNSNNPNQQTGSMENDNSSTDISKTEESIDNKKVEVGESDKPETIDVDPNSKEQKEVKTETKTEELTEEPKTEDQNKEIPNDLDKVKEELISTKNLLVVEKESNKKLKKEISLKEGKIEELTNQLRELNLSIKSKEFAAYLSAHPKYKDEKVRIEAARKYAQKLEFEDLKELIEIPKNDSKKEDIIEVQTGSNESVDTHECTCGKNKKDNYEGVKLFTASKTDNNNKEQTKSIRRAMNENLNNIFNQ